MVPIERKNPALDAIPCRRRAARSAAAAGPPGQAQVRLRTESAWSRGLARRAARINRCVSRGGRAGGWGGGPCMEKTERMRCESEWSPMLLDTHPTRSLPPAPNPQLLYKAAPPLGDSIRRGEITESSTSARAGPHHRPRRLARRRAWAGAAPVLGRERRHRLERPGDERLYKAECSAAPRTQLLSARRCGASRGAGVPRAAASAPCGVRLGDE